MLTLLARALPDPGTLAINLPAGSTISVNEEAGNVQIPIIRTVGSDGDVGFTIATTNGTALAGSDFTAPVSPQNLGDGVTTLDVPIPILNPGSTSEPNETFTVTLSAPTGGATLGAVKTVTVRIIDSVDTTAPTAPSSRAPRPISRSTSPPGPRSTSPARRPTARVWAS